MTDSETLFGRPFEAELVPVEWGTRRSSQKASPGQSFPKYRPGSYFTNLYGVYFGRSLISKNFSGSVISKILSGELFYKSLRCIVRSVIDIQKFLRVSLSPEYCPVIHFTNFHRVNSVIWFKSLLVSVFEIILFRSNLLKVFFDFIHSLIVRYIILCFVTIPPVRRFCY